MARGSQPYSSDIVLILAHPDINLLPLDQLPVQKVLSFTQPPTLVTAAYLSAICRTEGTQPDKYFFSTLQTGAVVDLRQCINRCQLGFFGITHNQETTRNNWEGALEKRAHFPQWVLQPLDESQHKALFRCLTKHTDAISYLDSRLVLHVDTVSELLAFDDLQDVERWCTILLCRIGPIQHRWTMNLGTGFFQLVT